MKQADNSNVGKPTQGEWEAKETGGVITPFIIKSKSGKELAHIVWGTKTTVVETFEEVSANAQLVAQAPALKSENDKLKEQVRQLREALDKIIAGGVNNFEHYSNGRDVDFKTVCGAMVEIAEYTTKNRSKEPHIFNAPDENKSSFWCKCGAYLTDEVHKRTL